MATKLIQGCVVSAVPATFFDGLGDERQSQQHYEVNWNTARCSGVVQHIFRGGEWCRVKWTIDGAVTRVALRDLQLDEWPHVDDSNESGILSNEDVVRSKTNRKPTVSGDADSSNCSTKLRGSESAENGSSESEESCSSESEVSHSSGNEQSVGEVTSLCLQGEERFSLPFVFVMPSTKYFLYICIQKIPNDLLYIIRSCSAHINCVS